MAARGSGAVQGAQEDQPSTPWDWGTDRQQAVVMEGSRQYFGHNSLPWEADADGREMEGSQVAVHHKRNPDSKIRGKIWENSFQKKSLMLENTSGSHLLSTISGDTSDCSKASPNPPSP